MADDKIKLLKESVNVINKMLYDYRQLEELDDAAQAAYYHLQGARHDIVKAVEYIRKENTGNV